MNKQSKIFCVNCGKKNHIYRDCTYPIVSYGIILFKIINNNMEILLIQRKDSLSYVEFLRGKYNIEEPFDKLITLIQNMTQDELIKINKLTFDKLWINLWGTETSDKQYFKKFQKEYHISKKKFDFIKEKNLLLNLSKKYKSKYKDTEFGIPKGRRNNNEFDLDCAKREFSEETDISCSEINILDCNPLKERFIGTNSIRYEHVYYLAFTNKDLKLKINENNLDQISEIKSIGWYNLGDCLKKFRIYEQERKELLKMSFNLINSIKY